MLREIVDILIYEIMGLESGRLADALHFFVYDSVKIFLLLFFMILAVGFLRTYLPKRKVNRFLTGRRKGVGNILAALFGSITPFCSCSSIPLFIGFLKTGINPGIAFSFLITSPLVNEYLVVVMLGMFGLKITALYVLSGITIGVVAGMILGNMNLEKYIEKTARSDDSPEDAKYSNIKERFNFGCMEASGITKKIWLWIFAGVGIGALIHGYVPDDAIQKLISAGGIFTVPAAVLIGVPIYANCAAVVPVAVVLFEKGVPLGTALAFMMSSAALSFPEAVILRSVMKLKLILIFFGIVAVSIIATGYLFNALQTLIL